MCDIVDTINSYFLFGNNRRHHRFQSWEKCYSHFQTKHANNDLEINELDCLQLGFYLSSWGMYRASSFLLQHTYDIHKPVLEEIYSLRYNSLWQLNYDDEFTNNMVNILFSLKSSIIEKYQQETTNQQKVSDTLVTKIIMGIMGITPAYDRFFKDGCKKIEVNPHSSFNEKSFRKIIQFYLDNIEAFNQAKENIQRHTTINYPVMKLVDMYFWSIGANKEFNQIE